ncbi:hypothetical protein GCM10008957_43380 [Deinococcus ruber]|uniref:Urease accessory protein UreH-like transmembrane domain-containing protein n=1 Tax=Deinococcus ruber TaxID=1848197 RepID=A0A918CJH8_9DEIO|nr:hypothetical protein GCM10008957_43380 [Deinococcus ruber]
MGAALLITLLLRWPDIYPLLRTLAGNLYAASAALSATVNAPLNTLRLQAGTSLLVPLLLGMMAVTAPCQLSTGAAALAVVLRDPHSGTAVPKASAFLLARMLMYSVMGGVVLVFFGGHLNAPGAHLLLIRRLIGPLMLLGAALLLGIWRPRIQLGERRAVALQQLASTRSGTTGAFLLGVAFSVSFCPTLFFLFFGLTIPMSLRAPLGFSYPAVFALGMTVPLLAIATLLRGRAPGALHPLTRRAVRLNRILTPLTGSVFLLAGLYDTFVYWLM